MDPSNLFSTPTVPFGGAPIRSTPAGSLDPADLTARLLAAYPSQVYEGWSPAPPSQDAAAKADPLTQLGLSQLFPDLFGHLGPPPLGQAVQEQGFSGSLAAGPQPNAKGLTMLSASDAASPSSALIAPDRTRQDANSLADVDGSPFDGVQGASQAGSLQLAPSAPIQLTPPPRLADVSDQNLDFTPTYFGVSGPVAYGRIGLQRDGSGFQSLGGPATPGHATPGLQILRDGLTPTAAVNVTSPSADDLSLKPVVQHGRLQMGIYDDTTHQKWVVDSTPGQSATLHNAKGEPILFTSTDLTTRKSRPDANPLSEAVAGLRDSETDQNLFSGRPDGSVFSARNLGYQESKLETAIGLGGLFKDLALLGGGKLAAAAGLGRTGPATSLGDVLVDAKPYDELTPKLQSTGVQAHHLNQQAAFGQIIPRGRGLAVGLEGDALTQPGSAHFDFHSALEDFWARYRNGDLSSQIPTNAQYGAALKAALIRAGASPKQAESWAEQAAQQRIAHGLLESDPVPRIPRRLPQARGQ